MKPKLQFRFLTLLTLLIVILAGCTIESPAEKSVSAPAGTIEMVDGLGRTISLDSPAKRVVSLAASNTEILFAIGASEQVVGREETSDYPEDALSVKSIGSVFGDINTEAILALEPDLILAAETNSPEQIENLAALNLTVYYLPNPVDFNGLYENLTAVGELTGHEDEATVLIESLRGRVAAVDEQVNSLAPVSIYYEVDATDVTAPYTVGSGTFQNLLINLAGGTNIASDLEYWSPLSQEELIARDPEVMIFGASNWISTTPESVAERPGWAAMSAVHDGRIYPIDSNWVDRPGPRLVDALEAIASILHPDAQ